MAAETTAAVLTERIDALADALRAAGVAPEVSSGLLAAAAAATMHAVTLEALLDAKPQALAPEPQAAELPAPRELSVRLAA